MLLILVAATSLSLSSCEWFKPARETPKDKVYKDDDIDDIQGTRVFDPETGEWRTVREVYGPVDTVNWAALPEGKNPPITNDSPWNNGGGTGGGETPASPTGVYNVSLILPFLTQNARLNSINPNSTLALQFYAGAKLAYQKLIAEGVRLKISVMDSEGSTTKAGNLTKGMDMLNADLIIGPYKRETVSLVAAFSKSKAIPLVVPFTAQMGVVENNPFYIQVNPSLKSHCEAITRHIRKRYQTDDVVLVALDNADERARLGYFHDANATIEGKREGSQFRVMLVGDNSAAIANLKVKPYIHPGKTNVFVVPSWANESFVYSLLRQLMVEKSEGQDIVVYGMPMWRDYEQVDYEFYEQLKVHVSSSNYVNPRDPGVKQFRQSFFNTYGAVPTDEAFLGYDVMLYFGTMLKKYGKAFPPKLDAENYDLMQSKFRFEKVVLDPSRSSENLNYYDQIENKFVYILKFQDYNFQPSD